MSMSASRHAWVSLRRSSLPRQRWFIIVLALLGGCALAMNTIVAGHVRDQIDAADAGKRLNYVVVDSKGRGSSGPINAAARRQMMGMDHVAKVYEWSQGWTALRRRQWASADRMGHGTDSRCSSRHGGL